MLKLLDALKQVKHAASKDPTRANLCAVQIEKYADHLAVIATDGHRMSVRFAEWQDNVKGLWTRESVLAAIKTKDLTKLERHEGVFPSWVQVVPDRQHVNTATVNRLRFTSAAKLAGQLSQCDDRAADLAKAANDWPKKRTANKKSSGIVLKLTSKTLTIDPACIALTQDYTFTLRADDHSRSNIKIGVNPAYLLSALQSVPRHLNVTIQLDNPLAPIRIDCPDGYEVVVPMRI